MQVSVRPARPSDKAAIGAFTRDTFSWGDYVFDAFDDWMEADEGVVLVAADGNDVAVAVSRAVRMSDSEIWLHAARVHPDHRRQGIGQALSTASLEWGQGAGARVARLMVEGDNEIAQGQVAKAGYRKVASFFSASRRVPQPAARLMPYEPLRPAPIHEVETAFSAWTTSDLARVGHMLYPRRWSMRAIQLDDLANAANTRGFWECPEGWVVLEFDDDGAFIPWMSTIPTYAGDLVSSVMARLENDRVPAVWALLPHVRWLIDAFEANDFDISFNGVWEIAL